MILIQCSLFCHSTPRTENLAFDGLSAEDAAHRSPHLGPSRWPHLLGSLVALLPPGVRFPGRHRRACVSTGVRARVQADAILSLRCRRRVDRYGEHHQGTHPALKGIDAANIVKYVTQCSSPRLHLRLEHFEGAQAVQRYPSYMCPMHAI